jgi:exopolysaccharide production protein ExoZ
MVVAAHLSIQIPSVTPYLSSSLFLDTDRLVNGVDIFFVISGFIMMVTSRHSRPVEFAVRRIFRIVPLYWLLTVTLALLVLFAPQFFRTTSLTTEAFMKSLFFIPYTNPGQLGELRPLLALGWTLNYEMFFYAVFALTLILPVGSRLLACGAAFALLVGSRLLISDLDRIHSVLGFYTSPQIFEFWLGMAIGTFYHRGALRMHPGISLAFLVVGFACLLSGSHPLGNSILATMLPSGAIVLGAVSLDAAGRTPIWKLPALLGDASYSVYLSHVFTMGCLRVVWVRLGLDHGSVGFAIAFESVGLAVVAIAAVILYRVVERPTHDGLLRWYRRSSQQGGRDVSV